MWNPNFLVEKRGLYGRRRAKARTLRAGGGGTLFLDELTSLPLELQPKLLRAIETKEIWTLGAEKPEQVQVRPVAATNANIDAMIKEELFVRTSTTGLTFTVYSCPR